MPAALVILVSTGAAVVTSLLVGLINLRRSKDPHPTADDLPELTWIIPGVLPGSKPRRWPAARRHRNR